MTPAPLVDLDDRRDQPHLDQVQQVAVADPTRQGSDQLGVRDPVEVIRQVRVDDLGVAPVEQPVDVANRVQGIVVGSIGVLLRLRIGLKDRLQDQHHSHLRHAVPDGPDPQRAWLAIRFGEEHASRGARLIRSVLQVPRQFVQPPVTPVGFDALERLGVDPRSPTVGAAPEVGESQDVAAVHLVVQSVKAVVWAHPSLWRATSPGASEPSVEVLGSRPSPGPRVPSDVGLELRPLPSAGVTRLRRYYGPVRHPRRPGLSLADFRSGADDSHRLGLPVLRRLSSCPHASATTPVGSLRFDRSWDGLFHPFPSPLRRRPSPAAGRVGPHVTTFEACSAFTHVLAGGLAGVTNDAFVSEAPTASLPPPPLR